ncbi:glycoside hydrolase family 2 protein [Aestuariimicrobium ganziense]|uniref:glycoside hydrolase family 2 protein n=1 Tax=Aestuariimicrobium ganziense TaxID=2773677 RepID=UPI001942F9B6|nr:glycoside hydrolase family 2 protein [Aestuariimicrobium ganziense]
MTTRVTLSDWTLSGLAPTPVDLPGSVPATVPGCVHTDLQDAGLIPDPYFGENEKLLTWIGRTPWRYAAPLPATTGHDRVDLVCDGLDTVATVRVNDAEVGQTQNMHRRYRFDVTEQAARGGVLIVDFGSPISEADRRSVELHARPQVGNNHPYNALRKMACSFGWDWGIETASSGIWRDIRLEGWSVARLDQVLTDATVAEVDGLDQGAVSVRVRIERARDVDVTVRAEMMGGLVHQEVVVGAGQTEATLALAVGQVERWWPVGHGGQTLYPITVTLSADGTELDRVERRLGFRTVTLTITPDSSGTPFALVVNGRPILVKGVNWIPDDTFPHRITRGRYHERFQQCLQANVNLIRVWGGGIYEDDNFFELADELGLMTWQDFLLACAAYAEEDPLYSEIEAEARDNVARIGHHPSLVVLNGNNENLWGRVDWGWDQLLDNRTWGWKYYHETFPAAVADLAPGVCYTPGSPWSPSGEGHQERPNTHPNDELHGSVHLWETWNRLPASHYRDYSPRFVAEFGWQGPPTWTTLTEAVDDDPITPQSPGIFVHQKAPQGNDKLTAGLLPEAPLPQDFELWHWAMQWNQAHSLRTGIEWYRSIYPHCMGTIMWQINDCWPVISWAAVDGMGRPKPLLHTLKQVHEPRLLTVVPEAGGLRVAVLNDTDEPLTGDLVITRRSYMGEILAYESHDVMVAARGIVHVWASAAVAEPGEVPGEELVLAELGGARGWWFFTTARESALEAADYKVKVDGNKVKVKARNLVRDLTLLVDKADPNARVDVGMINLLPGDHITFHVSGAEIDEDGAQRALASLNDVIAGTRAPAATGDGAAEAVGE